MIDLKSVLREHPNCLRSRSTFKSVLTDLYSEEKRTINILTILFECGIAERIKQQGNISAHQMQAFIMQVENEYGISEKYSQEAILIWAEAFHCNISVTQLPNTGRTQILGSPSSTHEGIHYVEGDVNDYEILKRKDGYYITHFNGFEEETMTIPSMIDGKIIKGIGLNTFQGCTSVKKVIVGEGIEVIEDGAFKDCKRLENISLPVTLRRIGSELAEYENGAFAETNLKSVIIPENVNFLGPYSFYCCNNLAKVKISDKITIISDSMFSNCTSLSEIILPPNLMLIESYAFENCYSLGEVHVPMGTKYIGNDAFHGASLTSIYLPPTIEGIGEDIDLDHEDFTFGFNPSELTIYCTAGSFAMKYARKNNIKCAKASF